MLGSSRDLLRCLDTVFGRLEDILDHENTQDDPDVALLCEAIRAFLHKHDTLHSIKQTINVNDHLLRVYNTFIEPHSGLKTQTFFLNVLIQFVPILLEDASMLWLKTYLPTALDSAGVDLKFTEMIQDLVIKLSNSEDVYVSSNDTALEAARRQRALKIMNHILNIYLGRASVSTTIKREENSQMQLERQRFMRKNCAIFLLKYGARHPLDLFAMLDAQFRYPSERLDILLFLSQFLESSRNHILPISGSSLITSLFKSLLFDNNMYIAEAALNCAFMAIPHVALHEPSQLLISDLFVAFLRLTVWGSKAHVPQVPGTFWETYSITWNAAEIDVSHSQQEYVTRKLGRGPSTANIQHLATLLYGLVPYNFCNFCKDPELYISKFPPQITTVAHLDYILDFTKGNKVIQNLYNDQLQAFKLHPVFVDYKSPSPTDLELELANPVGWFKAERTPTSLSLACYKLNAGLVFDIPFSWLDADIKLISSNGSMASLEDSHLASRKNSSAGFLSMTVKDGLAQKIVLENSLRRKASGVEFRETSFEEKPTEELEKVTSKGYLEELYDTHEKMYAPNDQGSLQIQRPTSSATTSIETKAVQSVVKAESSESKEHLGSVDEGGRGFYHRELTILANELEFSNYMRHVTTMQYIDMRLKLNQLQRDTYIKELSNLEEMPKVVSDKKESPSQANNVDVKALVDQLEVLGLEKSELERKLKDLEKTYSFLQNNVDDTFSSIVPKREAEIAELKRQLEERKVSDVPKEKPIEFEPPSEDGTPVNIASSEKEKRIFELQTELEVSKDLNGKLTSDLVELKQTLDTQVKSYEARLATSKQALSESVGKYSLQYEKKIQELSAVILRYEGLLDERNSRIKQLSSLKPITIPATAEVTDAIPIGTYRANDRTIDPFAYRRHERGAADLVGEGIDTRGHGVPRDRSNSSLESQSSASHRDSYPQQKPPTSRYNSSTSVFTLPTTPIIKGRGGLQKRSKVKM